MKNLEDYIRTHREAILSENPHPEHFQRFSGKLSRLVNPWTAFLKIAAIVIAGLLIPLSVSLQSGLLTRPFDQQSMLSDEVEQAIQYYDALNKDKENEILALPLSNGFEKLRIQKDIELYDAQYKLLMKDLQHYPNDERIIRAIIEYKRAKSDLLDHIYLQLKESQS